MPAHQGCPPRAVRGSVFQAEVASSVNHTAKLPRRRRAASYAAEFMTSCFCSGVW